MGECRLVVRAALGAGLVALLVGCGSAPEVGPQSTAQAPAQDKPAASGQKSSAQTQALFSGIWSHDPAAVEAAIRGGADPDDPLYGASWKTVDGKQVPTSMLALHSILSSDGFTAAEKLGLVTVLAKAGADLDARDFEGNTALHTALHGTGSLEIARALLANGASPGLTSRVTLLWRIDGKLKEEVYEEAPLITLLKNDAYSTGEKAGMIALFRKLGADMNPVDNTGSTPLHWAVDSWNRGGDALVRVLLENGADPNARDKNQYTAFQGILMTPELTDYLGLLRASMKAGADPTIPIPRGLTSIHYICEQYMYGDRMSKKGIGLTDVLDILLSKGADVDVRAGDGRTPLFVAAGGCLEEAARYLIAHGASPTATDKAGRTMLHAVCASNRDVPISLLDLILVPGVNIDAQDPDGNTAVNIAAGSDGMFPVVKYLVEKGARLDIPNENEVAPRGTALQVGAKKNAEYLKQKKGATYVSRFPAGNKAAACVAVLSGDPSAIDALQRADLEAMTARTSFGVPATPLHLAVERGDTSIIEALCRRGPDWNVGDRYGRSPLMHAVILGRADIVSLLLSAGADPTKEDDWGASAFSRAASMRPAIARLINERGYPPKTEAPGACGIWAGDLELVKALSPKTPWEQDAVNLSVAIGETRITELLAPTVPHKEKTPQELIDAARENEKAYAAYAVSAQVPPEAPTRTGGIALKRGSFPYVVESWSPWLAMKADKKLKDYPVAVYVPKDYDGSAAYGLIVSMIHAQSANQNPRPEFAKILDKRKLIWVGFDPYNGIYEPFADTHECLALAAVYNMLGYYRIDRSRIYMAGFSWGGRLTGEIVPKQPRIFSGGIAIGGCFTTGQRVTPAFRYAREHVRMVMVTGDWDYNRVETYNGYSLLTTIGFRNCLFIQEPLKGHSVLSAESFERALQFLDDAPGRTQ